MPKSKNNTNRMALYGALLSAALMVGMAPAAMNWFVDPYEYFGASEKGKKRGDAVEKTHYPLWKFSHYKNDANLIVLGDSRARALRNKYWKEYGSAPAFNFAYGGGTIPEIYSTFLAVRDDPKLKTIVVGIPLRSFDERHRSGLNRVPEAKKVTASSASYLKNWFVAQQSWRFFEQDHPELVQGLKNLVPQIAGEAVAADLGKPGQVSIRTLLLPEVCYGCDLPKVSKSISLPATKGPNLGLGRGNRTRIISFGPVLENFPSRVLPKIFARQVKTNATSDWRGFRFSETYFEMMEEMARWADAREDRQLVFVIPPTIVELQQTITKFGLDHINLTMRKRLAGLAPVIDLDFPNALTRDLGNFSDAYHFNARVARQIVGEVMSVQGSTAEQEKKIKKQRKLLHCPSLSTLKKDQSASLFGEGQSCRVWRRS